MKIHIAIFLAATLLLLSACGPSTPAPVSTTEVATTIAMPVSPTALPGTAKQAAPAAAIVISEAWSRRSTVAMPAMPSMPSGMPTASGDMANMMSPTAAPMMPAASAAPNNAVYMTIRNSAGVPDKLVKAAFDFAGSVELHTVDMKDGVMDMHQVPAIDVPANGEVQLKPGSYHIMLIGMKRDFAAGDKLKLKLTFANAGTLDIEAEVRAQ